MVEVRLEIWILSVLYLGENVLSHIVNTGIEHGLCKRLNTRREAGSSHATAESNSIHKTILFQQPTFYFGRWRLFKMDKKISDRVSVGDLIKDCCIFHKVVTKISLYYFEKPD